MSAQSARSHAHSEGHAHSYGRGPSGRRLQTALTLFPEVPSCRRKALFSGTDGRRRGTTGDERRRGTTGDDGGRRGTTRDDGGLRETTGDDGGRRETRDDGGWRETTGDDGGRRGAPPPPLPPQRQPPPQQRLLLQHCSRDQKLHLKRYSYLERVLAPHSAGSTNTLLNVSPPSAREPLSDWGGGGAP